MDLSENVSLHPDAAPIECVSNRVIKGWYYWKLTQVL